MIKNILIFVFSIFIALTGLSAFADPSLEYRIDGVSVTKVAPQPRPVDEVAGGLGKEHRKPPKYATLPTGKTLPQGIFRIDFPTAYTFDGTNGFNTVGKHINNGFSIERWMMGAIIQYGITDSVSIGLGIPFVLSNHMSLDGNVFAANSEFFSKYFNKAVNDTAKYLSEQNLCPNGTTTTFQECRTKILDENFSLPSVGSQIVLPTGELYTLQPDIPIKDQLRNLVVNAAVPQNGKTGLGDIQLGLLWNVVSERTPWRHVPIFFAMGLGLRFPTGQFDIPMAFRQTGGDGMLLTPGGTFDGIFRWNLDYEVTPGTFFSWQNMIEYSFTKAVLNRSSMINPGSFNTADPSYAYTNLGIPAPYNQGDGVANAMTFSRKGVRFLGFLEANWGVGNLTPALKPLALYVQGKYNIAAQNLLNGVPVYLFQDQFYLNDASLHKNYGPEQFYSVVGGIKLGGLPYMIPLEFSTEYEYLFYGKNLFIAPMNILMVLAVYF